MRETSLAKVNGPVIGNILVRERLFRVLDQARNKRAIWVAGLPGSGKTTFVASYLSSNRFPHAWYHIDSSDADLATFFYYLRYVVKGLTSSQRARLPLLTPEYLPNIDTYARRYFDNLYSMLPVQFVLVFDNYHEIGSSPAFHSIINEALTRVPEHGNVVLISRTEPPGMFMRLKANSGLAVIDNDLMKFTPEEVHGLVHLRWGRSPGEETARKLHSWTDGWAAGIVLLLEQHKEQEALTAEKGLKGHQAIFDYFSAEIFDKIAPEEQNFLLRTSFLPFMTVEMATRMTGNGSSEKILDTLVRSYYFTIRHRNNTYKYHDLFREFLLSRATSYFDEDTLRRIHRQAGAILQENDKPEEAIDLFHKSGDWKALKQIIKARAPVLISQGRNMILETWIKKLPEEEFTGDPWLLYWLGEACAVFNPVQGRAYFERAFQRFKDSERNYHGGTRRGNIFPGGVYLSWCGIIETYIYEYGNFVPTKEWIAVMEKIIRTHSKFPSQELEARVLSLLVFVLAHYNPYHPKIGIWADRTLKFLKHIKNPDQRVYCLFSILHYYSWTGNITKESTFIESMQKSVKSSPIKTQLMQHMYIAGHYRHRGLKEACLRFVSEGIEIADKFGAHFLDHMIIVQAVYMYLGIGDMKKTEEFLRKMEPTVNRYNALHVIQYDTLSGWVDHLHGNNFLAIEKIKRSLDLSIKAHIPFAQGLCRFALSQVLYEQGIHKGADKHYDRGILIARRMKSRSLEFIAYCMQAYRLLNKKGFTDMREAENEGLKMLKRTLAYGKAYSLVNEYFVGAYIMTSLSLKALEHDIFGNYVQTLIRRLELFPDPPPIEYEDWPWQLRVYTLGGLKILRDVAPVELSRKAQARPIELLQFLIVNHDRAVELDQISSVLWPDAQGDYARQTLDTTIHRLRKLLDSTDAVRLQAGRLVLNPKMCWMDVVAFEHHLDKMDAIMDEKGDDARKGKVNAAVKAVFDLYKGHFFSGSDLSPWAIRFRDRLHDRFLRFIEQAGGHYEGIGDRHRAIAMYQKGLETDSRVEFFYQRLMAIYKSSGRYAEAASMYVRCEAVLHETFGIEPSDRTKDLYRSLKP
ncbi:MAG: winged helix-turn-helix domain-containing protein [Deltaproteobacteria bacterium]|nr:winged helix-turn-helix domain-containing protein [Deltaproteobacteria bacterium]